MNDTERISYDRPARAWDTRNVTFRIGQKSLETDVFSEKSHQENRI